MATEADKPESIFTMEREIKETFTEASRTQVAKFPPEENKQEGSLNDKSQGSIENNSRGKYLMNDIEGEKNDEEESKNLQKCEDYGMAPKSHSTTVLSEVDLHHKSSPPVDEYSEESSPPTDTRIDPEILHSCIVPDEIENSRTSSEFIENVSTEGDVISSHSAFPMKHNDAEERESGHGNKEPLSSPLVGELKNEITSTYMEPDNAGKLEDNSETKTEGVQDSTTSSLEMKESSYESELPRMGNTESCSNNKQSSFSANAESNREVPEAGCMNINQSHTENQNKSLEEDVGASSCESALEKVEESRELRCNQSTEEPEDNHEENLVVKKVPETVHMDPVHETVPLDITVSGEDSPPEVSIQEQQPINSVQEDLNKENYGASYACDTEVEDAKQEYQGAHIEENHANTENAEENAKQESTKGVSSQQEFQIIAQANKAFEEANNLELLDAKEFSVETSNKIPKADIPQAAKDVWEQKEASIPKESEETKEVNEELAPATCLVSQASEDNSGDQKAVEVAVDSTDNTNATSMKLRKEENSIEKVHVDDGSVGTSDIYLHEKSQETIKRTSNDFSSEEKHIPGLELKDQTAKSEQADHESIILPAENEAAEKAKTSAENDLQDPSTDVIMDSGETQTFECHDADKTAGDSSKEITSTDSVEAVVETNFSQFSSEENEERKQDQLKQEEDLQVKADEFTNSADGTIEVEEPEAINTTQSFLKQVHNEEKEIERSQQVSIEDQIANNSLSEEQEEEKNINETKEGDKLNPEEVPGSAGEDMSRTNNKPSYGRQIPSEDENVKGATQVAQEFLSDGPADKQEGLNHEDMIAPGQLQPEIHQRFHTEMSSEIIVVQNPSQLSIAEDAVNYSIGEEGNKERNVTDAETFRVELNPDADLGAKADEIYETMTNESQITEVTSKNTSNFKFIETPLSVSFAEEAVKCNPAEESNSEKNVNDSGKDELKPIEDPEPKVDAVSEIKESASETTAEAKESETLEATKRINTEIDNDKDVKTPLLVSFAEEAVKYNPVEETNSERNVNDMERDESKQTEDPEPKGKEPETTETTQRLNIEMESQEKDVETPLIVSVADAAKCNPAEERNSERNISDIEINEFKAAEDPKPEKHEESEITESESETTTEAKEPETTEATQELSAEMKIQEEDVETPLVSFAGEAVKCKPSEEKNKESNVNDAERDELQAAEDPELEVHEESEITESASETTIEAKKPQTKEGTRELNTQMKIHDKDVETPLLVSFAEEAVKCNPAEEIKEERNDNDTERNELKAVEEKELKAKEPDKTEATQALNTEMEIQGKDVETHLLASFAEEAVKCNPAEERNDESNVNDTETNELRATEDPESAIETTTEAKEPETTEATQELSAEMKIQEKDVETPLVSFAGEAVKCNPSEEKNENNVNDTERDELKAGEDPELEVHEESEITEIASEITIKAEKPQAKEGTQEYSEIKVQEKDVETPLLVSFAEEAMKCNPAEEIDEERNVNDTERNELKTVEDQELKPKEPEITEVTQGLNTEMEIQDKDDVETPLPASFAEEAVKSNPAEERNDESNANDTERDELRATDNPEIASETTNEAKEPETTEATQELSAEMKIQEKDVETPLIAFAGEVVKCNPSEETNKECNVNDTGRGELNAAEDPELEVHEESEITESASEITIEAEKYQTKEGTQQSNTEMKIQDNDVETPFLVSFAEEAVKCKPAEERNERNVNDTERNELKAVEDQELKAKEPEPTEATQGLNTEMEKIQDKDVETPLPASFAEETVKCNPAEERNEESNANDTEAKEPETAEAIQELSAEKKIQEKDVETPLVSFAEEVVKCNPSEEKKKSNVNDTERDELKAAEDPELEVHEESEITENASEIRIEAEKSQTKEGTRELNTEMKIQDKDVETSILVSSAEEVVKCKPAEERNEERNVNDTERNELKAVEDQELKAKEPEPTEATQGLNTEMEKIQDKDVETPLPASFAEETVKCNPAEERNEESNANDTEAKEPETTEAIQELSAEKKIQEKDVETPLVSFAEEVVKCNPSEEKKKSNVNDTERDELKAAEDPELEVHEESEITENASEIRIEAEKSQTKEGTRELNTEMKIQDKDVETSILVSSAEEVVKCKPAEERNEERNVNDTERNELKAVEDQELKAKEPEPTEATQGLNTEMEKIQDKDVETPLPASFAEETVKCNPAEERNEESNANDTEAKEPETTEAIQELSAEKKIQEKDVETPLVSFAGEVVKCNPSEEKNESNVNDTERDELKAAEDPELEVHEESEITESASEITIEAEKSQTKEGTREFNTEMKIQDKDVETSILVSSAEEVVKCKPAEERNEERNVHDTERNELKTVEDQELKAKEPETTEVTQGLNTEMEIQDKEVETPLPASYAEEVVKCNPAEERNDESNANDTERDELRETENQESASETTTEAKEPEMITEATQELSAEMKIQEKDEKKPLDSFAGEAEKCNPSEEKNKESNVNNAERDELKEAEDLKLEVHEESEITESASGTTIEAEKPQTKEGTQELSTEMKIQDKDVKTPLLVSFADEGINCNPAEEITEERNVNDTERNELKAAEDQELKAKEPDTAEATQRLNTEMEIQDKNVETPLQASFAEEAVKCDPTEERNDESNANDTERDEPWTTEYPESASETTTEAKEPGTTEATQELSAEMKIQEKDVETQLVSFAGEAGKYNPAEERKEERNDNDTERNELKAVEDPELKAQEPETTEATQGLNTEMKIQDKDVETPFIVSFAEVKCSPAEETNWERNVNDTERNELKAVEDPELKAEEPETTEATQGFNPEMEIQDKDVETPLLASFAEEAVKSNPAEEKNDESNANDTERDELRATEIPESASETTTEAKERETTEGTLELSAEIKIQDKDVETPLVSFAGEAVKCKPSEEKNKDCNVNDTGTNELNTAEDPELEVHEESEITDSASETTIEAKEPETAEATQELSAEMKIQDKDVETTLLVSFSEEAVKCNPTEERKEERNDNDTERNELKAAEDAELKAQEPETTEATQGLNTEMKIKDKDVETPLSASFEEEAVKCNPAEKRNDESNANDTQRDELRAKEDPESASETTTEAKEPETTEAPQELSAEMKIQEKDVETPLVSFAGKAVKCNLSEEKNKESNVNDAERDELKAAENPELEVHEESEITESASEIPIEAEKTRTKEGTQELNAEMKIQDKDVETALLVSLAEEAVKCNPAEEIDEERNVNDTERNELKTVEDSELQAKAPETTEVTQGLNTEMEIQDKDVEIPLPASFAEEALKCNLAEERKEERNDKDTEINESKAVEDPELKAKEPEKTEATQGLNTEMEIQEKDVETPLSASLAGKAVKCNPAEERNDESNSHDTEIDELRTTEDPESASETTTEAKEPETTEATQEISAEMKIQEKDVETPLVSFAGEAVKSNPSDEKNKESYVVNTEIDELKAAENPEREVHEESEITESASETTIETKEGIQELNTQMKIQDKDVETPLLVSFPEEAIKCNPAEETNEERNVHDTERNEFKAVEDAELKAKEPETTEATQRLNTEMEIQDKDVETPLVAAFADKAVKCNPAEEGNEESNANDTERGALRATEDSESASETTTEAKEPEITEATQKLSAEKNIQENDVETPLVSFAGEAVKCNPLEENNKESNVNDTERDELKAAEEPELEVHEESEVTESASETTIEAEKPQTKEGNQELNTNMKIQDKDDPVGLSGSGAIHTPFESSIPLPDLEIMAKEDTNTGNDSEIELQHEETLTEQKESTGEILQPAIQKLEPENASDAVEKAANSPSEESCSKDYKTQEKCEEKMEISGRTSVDENEKKFHNQEHQSTLVMEQVSARDVQNEPHPDKRTSEGTLTDREFIEAKEETGKSTSAEAPMTSLHDLLQMSKNANSEVSVDSKMESAETTQRDDMKDVTEATLECAETNTDEDKDEEDTNREEGADSESPVIVEASRDADVKVTPKKSHNILSGVGSKVKHSIAKVKKVITGKSSHPKASSPK